MINLAESAPSSPSSQLLPLSVMLPVVRNARPLLSCTCSHLRAYSTPQYAYPVPSTSATTLDDLPSFEALLPPNTSFPLRPRPTKLLTPRQRRLAQAFRPLPPLTPLPSRRVSVDPPPARSSISPHLPLVTRERNFLLSLLRTQLYSATHDPDVLWEALVKVLQYPSVLPSLPPSHFPSSERAPTDGAEDPRRPIQLSLFELRRAFTVLSRAKPRTRTGLSRLLVLVELLAMRSLRHLPPAPVAEGVERDREVGELRGGGIGLRSKDWVALILVAAGSYRSPRPTPEIASATSLFSQWARKHTRGDVSPQGTTEMYNSLLRLAVKARSWGLFEGVEDRMRREQVSGDVHTVGIHLLKDDERGAHVETIWAKFERGFVRLDEDPANDGTRWTGLWNTMLWILAKRGSTEDAMRMYLAMRVGKQVDLRTLAPRSEAGPEPTTSYWTPPPSPDLATYTMLIQAFAHRGDLNKALRIMRDQFTKSPPYHHAYPPTLHAFTCLFRGFATYGSPPPSLHSFAFDPRLLSGDRVSSNAIARTESFSAFRRLAEGSSDAPQENVWTLAALQSLYNAFRALSPPLDPSLALPFAGKRSAPTSKQLFWLVLAFEKLSGWDSRLVLRVWEEVEETFEEMDGQGGWKGWRIDKRLASRIRGHREALEAQEAAKRGYPC